MATLEFRVAALEEEQAGADGLAVVRLQKNELGAWVQSATVRGEEIEQRPYETKDDFSQRLDELVSGGRGRTIIVWIKHF